MARKVHQFIMEINKTISTVIVNYNGGPGLVTAVRAALPGAHELFVVDNASSDNSIRLLNQELGSDRRLHIIANNSNVGFAAACNQGVERAAGAYILFLNPDCELAPGALGELLSGIAFSPDVGMVGGLLLNPDGSEQAGGRRAIPTPWRSFVRAFGLSRLSARWPKLFFDFHLHKEPLPTTPVEVEAISGACMLVKREALQEVGHLDTAYFMHCEDLDWCMRFWRANWKIMFIPSARMLHHKGVCSRSRPIFVEWHKHKGMIRFYRKHFSHQYPGLIMVLVVLGVCLRFVMVTGFLSLRHIATSLGLLRA